MLTRYRQAFTVPGAWQFSSTAFVARLPIAMVGLGIVLLISSRTGSYALAGALSATFQLAAAGAAIVTSRWTDRWGQRRTLPWLAIGHAVGLIAFVVVVLTDQPVAVQAIVAAFAGACQPAVGSMVRARWAYVPSDDQLGSAFAIESILDELIFTIGPLLTAFLAFQVALALPLIAAGIITVIGSLALALQRRTEPPAHRTSEHPAHASGSAFRLPGMALIVAGALGLGGVFGAYEVTVVAFTQEAGQDGASGLVLGLWALGSMIGGLAFGSRQWRIDLPRQLVIVTGVVTVTLIPVLAVRTIPWLCVVTFIAGLAVAPALISVFSLTQRLVPSALLTEGLTWTNSGLALGFSLGTALNGIVIDAAGTTVAFAVPIACAAEACLVAYFGRHVLRRACAGTHSGPPGIPLNTEPVPGPAPGGVIDDPIDNGGWGQAH